MKHDEFDPFPDDEYMARLLKEITPRPWHAEEVISLGPVDIVGPDVPGHGSPRIIASVFSDESGEDWDMPMETAIANAAFIAACRTYVPWSVFAIDACREFLEMLDEDHFDIVGPQAAELLARISSAEAMTAEPNTVLSLMDVLRPEARAMDLQKERDALLQRVEQLTNAARVAESKLRYAIEIHGVNEKNVSEARSILLDASETVK